MKQAINHITSDVNTKLDKMDMDTVKDYFEGKLKDLNSKVQRKPNEDKSQAAASRCMLLQPANCISCDRPVHLYREGARLPSLPLNKPLPCSKSNRPYISCDLNDVRQKMYDVQKQRWTEQTESLGQAKIQNELLKLGYVFDILLGKCIAIHNSVPCVAFLRYYVFFKVVIALLKKAFKNIILNVRIERSKMVMISKR